MNKRSLKTRFRGIFNSVILNPLFTKTFDRVRSVGALGARGEREAERYLLRLGLIIVDRGYADGMGEIDLIAVDDKTIVFVEVKTRTSDIAGVPAEAVDENKQQRITKTAVSFLKRYDLLECRVRFDVVSLEWPKFDRIPVIQHYQDAFAAVGDNW